MPGMSFLTFWFAHQRQGGAQTRANTTTGSCGTNTHDQRQLRHKHARPQAAAAYLVDSNREQLELARDALVVIHMRLRKVVQNAVLRQPSVLRYPPAPGSPAIRARAHAASAAAGEHACRSRAMARALLRDPAHQAHLPSRQHSLKLASSKSPTGSPCSPTSQGTAGRAPGALCSQIMRWHAYCPLGWKLH